MEKIIRRVVTGHDGGGRAVVVSDGPAPFVHVNKLDPDSFSIDIWRTVETPARIVANPEEPTMGPRRQLPTKNGSVLRINHFPPESDGIRHMTPEFGQGFRRARKSGCRHFSQRRSAPAHASDGNHRLCDCAVR